MKILLVSGYYHPETVGSGIWVRQLALDLKAMNHDVSVLTAFPSYPHGRIFPEYRGRWFLKEMVDGIPVTRTFTFATPSRNFWPRVASFGSLCASTMLWGWFARQRADIVYAVLPPLPLGVSAWVLAKAAGARLIVNIQDIYPDIAVTTGFLRNRRAIAFFRRMETWIYGHADRIVVIAADFKRNLMGKGVPARKIAVVPNWADPDSIVPGPRDNGFRRQHGIGNEFVVLYSGSISHNSHLEPVLHAAERLANDRFVFLIAGEGVHKESLQIRAQAKGLNNVRFLPFQPIELYPEALAAADVTLVTLSPSATHLSLPSKIYKQMAAARPIVAIADHRSELAQLIEESGCGLAVEPDDSDGLVEALRRLAVRREEAMRMGDAGREYLINVCSRSKCVAAIEQAFIGAG
jgi:colanic acid biosynthesis glycosyl transferase WcaI